MTLTKDKIGGKKVYSRQQIKDSASFDSLPTLKVPKMP